MKPVYIVRHGQTEYNVAGKAQGWKDSPLTRMGMAQALMLRRWMDGRHLHFHTIYTSDLGRAVQTASILAEPETQVLATDGLREISFGDLDGQDSSAFRGVDWEKDYESHGGESYEQAVLRAWKTLMSILETELQKSETEPVLIVTHGAILTGMYQLLDKSDTRSWPEQVHLHNCETLICQLNPQTGRLQLQALYHPSV